MTVFCLCGARVRLLAAGDAVTARIVALWREHHECPRRKAA